MTWMAAFYTGSGSASCPALNPSTEVDVTDPIEEVTVNTGTGITVGSYGSINVSSGTLEVNTNQDITPECIHN